MNKKLMLYLGLALLSISYSCKKDSSSKSDKTPTEAKVKLKAYNPYALANMQKAMASLIMTDLQLTANQKLQ